jgi:hypothetical protein
MQAALCLVHVFVFAVLNNGHMTSGQVSSNKESVPLTSMVKQPPDLIKMMERVVAGNEAVMSQLRQLEQQQREQQEQLERMNSQQNEERQHQQESLAERQHLKQLISNLTSELTSVEGAIAGGQHQTDQQALRQRVRRELQAMACNVTAELQTVIGIAEMTNHRLQQLETRNGELRRQMQQLNETMTSLERHVIGNISSTIVQQLQQQQMNDRLRLATLTESIKAEVRSATCQRQAVVGTNPTRLVPQLPSNITRTPRRLVSTNQNQRILSAQVNAVVATGTCVWGATELNDEVFVGRSSLNALEVYDIATMTFQRNVSITGMGCVNDMASALGCDFIYVVDNCNRLIHVVDEHGVRIQWAVSDTPFSVSITSECNALITFENTSNINEYTSHGQLVRQVIAHSDIGVPTHAVKLNENRYIVGQGQPGQMGLHRVCTIDGQGRLLQSYGGERGSGMGKLNTPARISVVNDLVLFVVDTYNDRVVMLNTASLTHVREVISLPTPTEFLVRISMGHDNSRMYAAHNDFRGGKCQHGHLKVIGLNWL